MTQKVLLGLIILIVCLFATIGKPQEQKYVEVTCSLSNSYPSSGEIIEGILSIKFHKDVICDILFVPSYKMFDEYRSRVVSGDTLILDVRAKKGDTKILKITIKLNDKPNHGEQAGVGGGIRKGAAFSKEGKSLPPPLTLINAACGVSLKYDEELDKFMPIEEWEKKMYSKPEYTYDIDAGMHVAALRPEAKASKIRAQMDSLKQLDSTLTDEETLQMLHDIGEPMVVRYGIHKKEEAVPILIKARRLIKEQGLSKWEAVDKVVEEMKKSKGRINFFRPDGSGDTNYSISSDSTPKQRIDITVNGTIKYKKHLYDRDAGVDTATVDMPLRYVKVYFRGYYKDDRAQYYGPCLTNSNGQFSYTIGGVSTPFYCMPLVFLRGPSIPSGPSGFNRVKVISDTIRFSFIPPPEDSITWRYRWDNVAIYSSPYDFGTKYCAEHWSDGSLWPDNFQPKSGASNIYDILLKSYEYCASLGDTMFRLTAKWQPNYRIPTGYWNDTLNVNGYINPYPPPFTTADEWSDDILWHEYGHHVMRTVYNDTLMRTDPHYWYSSYPERREVAFIEGWAHFFSAHLKGYYNWDYDTLLIDPGTPIGIKNYPGSFPEIIAEYHNIEDPWDFTWSGQWGFDFQKGPWCEGAVAGSIWDIYDTYDENWADGRNDTLTMGFVPIWDVFTDPTTIPCWDIYKYWDQWLALGYNHEYALREIFAHHGIGRLNPGELEVNGGDQRNDAQWRVKERRGQRETNIFYAYRSDFEFGPYAKIDSLNYIPGETLYSYVDFTVSYAMPYWYKVGAVDPESVETFTLPDSGIPYNLPPEPVPPAPVTNFAAFDTPMDSGGSITLTWIKSADDSIVTNYYVYRSQLPDIGFIALDSVSQGGETFVDSGVINGDTFYYFVRAHDGISGSNSSIDWAVASDNRILSNSPLASAYNNASRIIRNPLSDELLTAYTSYDHIMCITSTDEGITWGQPEMIAQGQFPTLVLDSQNNPCCLFGRWVGPSGFGSAQLYYTKYIDDHWTTPALLMSVDSVYIGIPRYAIPAPSANVDPQDTIHVTWMSPMGQEYPHRFAVWYGNLYALDTIPAFNYVQLDTIWVYESSPCPSLAIDGSQTIHVIYETDPAAPTLFYRYRESGIWRDKEIIESGGCYYPDFEFFGDRVHLVWDYRYPDTTVAHELHYRSKSSTGWDSIMNVYEPLPFNVFGEPVNVGGWYTIWANQDIYYSKFNGTYWEEPETVRVTSEISAHPTVLFRQDINDTCLYIAWTEGDSAPYSIQFDRIVVPSVPTYYSNLGKLVQSPYCIHRDGYWIFGDKPYESVDYGNDSLAYQFTGLDPSKKYRLALSYYFKPNPTKEEESKTNAADDIKDKALQTRLEDKNHTQVDEADKGVGRLIQELVVDGISLDTSFITPHKLVRISIWLPEEVYADGEITSVIKKVKGKVVVCGEISLYEFNGEEKESACKITSGPQSSDEQVFMRPFFFDNLYPNPTKGMLKIKFSSPDERKVSVKMYDVVGSVVKTVFNGKAKFGLNEFLIMPEDLAAGVYFVRLETQGYEKTKKVIFLR